MRNIIHPRRKFFNQILYGGISLGLSQNILAQNFFTPEEEIDWYDVKELGVEGKGWNDTTKYFDRLPAKAQGFVRDRLWDLSMNLKWTVLNDLDMPHMASTGIKGIDLYTKYNNKWRYVTTAGALVGLKTYQNKSIPADSENEYELIKNMTPEFREYKLFLPLYDGVTKLEIGIDNNALINKASPNPAKPIVFYGTSRASACASRPGMAFPSILGRRLRRPTVNLGFAGNGRMEIEVGSLLAELDPCVYVIDCLPNMNESSVSERTVPLVRKIREAHKTTPILLVEDRSYTNARFFPARKRHHQKSRKALKNAENY